MAKKRKENKDKTKKDTEKQAHKTKVTVKKLTIGQKLRDFNILYPWFKVLVTVTTGAIVVLVAIGVMRHGGMANGEEQVRAANETVELEVENEPETEEDGEQEGPASKSAAYVGSRPAKLALRKLEGKKLIALTFDDGPASVTTLRLLDILKEKKVKATFFVVGRMAQAAPEILKREEEEGHVIGSHTMTHTDLTTLNEGAIRGEVAAMDEIFRANLGHATKLTRPPYGAISEVVRTGVGQPLIIWTIDPEDWRMKDANAVRRHVVERAFDGAIVLMHDIYGSTVDAVGGMIDDLRKAGYEFVTVPEMAHVRRVQLKNGEVYGSFGP